MIRKPAILVAFVLALAACGSASLDTTSAPVETTVAAPTTTVVAPTTTVPPTTTTTISPEVLAEIEYEKDLKLIKTAWRAYSDVEAPEINVWLEDNNYPTRECTAEMYVAHYGFPDGFREEAVLDQSTVERDGEWAIPSGRAKGEVPEGRTYIMTVNFAYWEPGFAPTQYIAEVHATVLDGQAYVFIECED